MKNEYINPISQSPVTLVSRGMATHETKPKLVFEVDLSDVRGAQELADALSLLVKEAQAVADMIEAQS